MKYKVLIILYLLVIIVVSTAHALERTSLDYALQNIVAPEINYNLDKNLRPIIPLKKPIEIEKIKIENFRKETGGSKAKGRKTAPREAKTEDVFTPPPPNAVLTAPAVPSVPAAPAAPAAPTGPTSAGEVFSPPALTPTLVAPAPPKSAADSFVPPAPSTSFAPPPPPSSSTAKSEVFVPPAPTAGLAAPAAPSAPTTFTPPPTPPSLINELLPPPLPIGGIVPPPPPSVVKTKTEDSEKLKAEKKQADKVAPKPIEALSNAEHDEDFDEEYDEEEDEEEEEEKSDDEIKKIIEDNLRLIKAEFARKKINIQALRDSANQLVLYEPLNPYAQYALAYYYFNIKKPNIKKAQTAINIALRSKNPPKGASSLAFSIKLKAYRNIIILIVGFIILVVFLIKRKKKPE